MRKVGIEFFRDRQDTKAVQAFTCCINVCPEDCVNELSTAFFNRSAAFSSLKAYHASLKDIDQGIEVSTKTPEIKILIRKAECLMKLGRRQEFELCGKDIEEAISLLPENDRGNKFKQINSIKSN